jgi:hypothetical protein
MDHYNSSTATDKRNSLIKSLWGGKYRAQKIIAIGFLISFGGGLSCMLAISLRDGTAVPLVHYTAWIVVLIGYVLFGFGWLICALGLLVGLADGADVVCKVLRALINTKT